MRRGHAQVEECWECSVDLGGNPVGLDREGRVWISDHDGDGVRLLAQGFEDFLLELVSRA